MIPQRRLSTDPAVSSQQVLTPQVWRFVTAIALGELIGLYIGNWLG